MNAKTFRGRIWLTTVTHQVDVTCQATSPQQARNIIKGMYGTNFKSWAKQMASN